MFEFLKKKKKDQVKRRFGCRRSPRDDNDLYLDLDGRVYKKIYVDINNYEKTRDDTVPITYYNWNNIDGKVREKLFDKCNLKDIGYCSINGTIFVKENIVEDIKKSN